MNSLKDAFCDIYRGLLRYELWLTLGWRDVLSKYRRSWLGTLWITMSMGIISGVMGMLYSQIMHSPMQTYIPYLCVGFIGWMLLSALLTDGSLSFSSNSGVIKEIPLPYSVYVFRSLWRNVIIFSHNLIVYFLIMIIFRINVFPIVFLIIPSLILILLNGMWVGLLFGILNVRFRDFSQLVSSLMRLLFFITPIIWHAEVAKGVRGYLVHLNPFYYLIEILRDPLLGHIPGERVWVVVSAMTVIGWAVTLPIFARWRNRISYWGHRCLDD